MGQSEDARLEKIVRTGLTTEISTSYTWSSYPEGMHTFEVRALDNKGAYSEIIVWEFDFEAVE